MPTVSAGVTGTKEYDVYVLIRHRSWLHRIFWWLRPSYQIVVGQSFASAEEAARSAQNQVNAAGGRAIGIAADAMVCCVPKKEPEEPEDG